jgi:hypothetical protein
MELNLGSSNPHSAQYHYSSVLAPNNENYIHKAVINMKYFKNNAEAFSPLPPYQHALLGHKTKSQASLPSSEPENEKLC